MKSQKQNKNFIQAQQNGRTIFIKIMHKHKQCNQKIALKYGLNISSENLGRDILLNMAKKGLSGSHIKQFEQFFIKQFIKIDYLHLLGNHFKMMLTQLINIHFCKYSYVHFFINIKAHLQPQISIKKQTQSAKGIENQLINDQKFDNNYKINFQTSEEKAPSSITIDQFNHRNSKITYYAHAKFLSFLNKSMERLKVKHQIIKYCLETSTWPLGYNVIDFFRRLMAIKIFFPQLFPQIVNQFKIIIGEFFLKTKTKQDQIYAEQILIERYLKCIAIYSQSDNILEAAKCIYCGPINTVIQQKISSLPREQKAMQLQASISRRTEQKNDESANFIKHSPKLRKSHFINEEDKKLKNQIKQKKSTTIVFEVFKTNHHSWNPINKPSNFQLYINIDHVQLVQKIYLELDFQQI